MLNLYWSIVIFSTFFGIMSGLIKTLKTNKPDNILINIFIGAFAGFIIGLMNAIPITFCIFSKIR